MKIVNLCFITLMLCITSLAATETRQRLEKALTYVPQAKLVGEGRMRYLFWDIYDASLYSVEGRFRSDKPFALSLSYHRDIAGVEIAQRSIKEIKQQALCASTHLSRWEKMMSDIFPAVSEGDVLTGVRDSQGNARFFYNGREIGVINEPDFTQCFFAIWLDEKTSEPKLRQRLLGNANG
ncbi:chalcone isomerase family protein [Alteromonas ponticola]|uniref:Chalcone isomerase family protein n=1 Tax=Alteromonas aquimaris TaxID=2998417 RepID=A0ABT3P382_9ALTE|nr:chalcone isomerase family protein [Alteromonas aquimaris]MCW8106995.1 chalcone isomerase family protein [Alteromonas aquimaris]